MTDHAETVRAVRTVVLLVQDWLDLDMLPWLADDSDAVELLRESPEALTALEQENARLRDALRDFWVYIDGAPIADYAALTTPDQGRDPGICDECFEAGASTADCQEHKVPTPDQETP